jgi:general secretion pathway protein E
LDGILHKTRSAFSLSHALGLAPEQIESALAQRGEHETLARLLRRLRLASDETVATALASMANLPLLGNDDFAIPAPKIPQLNPAFLEANDAAVARIEETNVLLAVADPAQAGIAEGVKLAANRAVLVGVAPLNLIEAARTQAFGAAEAAHDALLEAADDDDALSDAAREAPVVRLVDELIAGAVRARASDLHLEPYAERLRVRLRVDGVLRDWRVLTARVARAVASRLKIMAALDIAERRLPQDGRTDAEVDGVAYDVRVATSPTQYGEGIVLRFLHANESDAHLGRVGLTSSDHARIIHALSAPYGLILVVGPTGAGKSTTLAGMVGHLNDPARKIVSIEDPIEYRIDGVTQIAIRPSIGLTFASALRGILRGDPDVIVVGELRDAETAIIATNAALTGHLVLATLHANDAASAAPRLIDMGVDPGLLRSTMRLVVAQRLVRKLCDCARPAPNGNLAPIGCSACDGLGYKGRIGVFEMIEIDRDISALIKPDCASRVFADAAMERGYPDMRADAVAKVSAGMTSAVELHRVLGA